MERVACSECDCSPNAFLPYAVFLGFYLGCETNFIMQVKFSCAPGDSHMDRQVLLSLVLATVIVYFCNDVFHFRQKDTAS
jgi:hypothetical protein